MSYQLVDAPPIQPSVCDYLKNFADFQVPSRLLHRKFSWEGDYEETELLAKDIFQAIEPLNIRKEVPERPLFQRRTTIDEQRIRRKPVAGAQVTPLT